MLKQMPNHLYTRESDLLAAEKRYGKHVAHVHKAERMIDVQTPHGYRDYRSRHSPSPKRGSDGLHTWLARPRRGMAGASALAPLSKISLPRQRRPAGRVVHDPDEIAMGEFYAKMATLERQMHDDPLCLAHEVMARLAPAPLNMDDEAAYVDAAANEIQRCARGMLGRKQLREMQEAAARIQSRYRGMQGRQKALKQAQKAADEAEAIAAKEEAEAIAAEAIARKEEQEAREAEAVRRPSPPLAVGF